MNNFITVNAERCIGCRTCEIACAVAHSEIKLQTLLPKETFSPRLKVIRGAKITLPVLCRQCENARCAEVCPTLAISRQDGAMIVDQSLCIGCKNCAIACPFGAMTVLTQEDSQALKCDLCHEVATGPACVRVCPTQALSIMDEKSMDEIIKEKREATAAKSLVNLAQ